MWMLIWRASSVPVQEFHERNSPVHAAEYEGPPERRPLTRGELQAFFDAADDLVERVAGNPCAALWHSGVGRDV
jgi:hypothetical protein